ncbi:PREDICTED: fasciclin-1-like [Nicrophorus vespilloides]|uniref:Fasciclin-1-like n=1 Tax=Nicrophorus vespilloides TaxID=110193 RepID=A0ABM1MS47_NICVS|nr:PREDICTED: fasciclin-1-like [Nicrophorus vespilloides]
MLVQSLLNVIILISCAKAWPNMIQKLAFEKDLSQFYSMLVDNRYAKSSLSYRELTIFAPTNKAFKNFNGTITPNLVLYHVVPMARTLENLHEASLDPILEEHPPLWINNDGKNIFINNARLLFNASNFIIRTRADLYGKTQVLHVIDEVLTPMNGIAVKPTAYDFLVQPRFWQFVPHTFGGFYKKVVQNRAQHLFKSDFGNTFFLPADQFIFQNTLSRIDRDTIETHIIPKKIIFTRSAKDEFSYTTKGSDKEFYDTIEFLDGHVRITRVSRKTHQITNSKTVQILAANIPVRNGVVHVVKEPLGLYDRRLTKFPYLPLMYKLQNDPTLNISNFLFEKTKIIDLLDDYSNATLFIPNDHAWTMVAENLGVNVTLLSSPVFLDRAKIIMRRHIAMGEYFSLQRLVDITNNLRNREVIIDVGVTKLLIKVAKIDGNAYIFWGKSIIKILRPDYECTNGVIHIIDSPFVFEEELIDLPLDTPTNYLKGAWKMLKLMLI